MNTSLNYWVNAHLQATKSVDNVLIKLNSILDGNERSSLDLVRVMLFSIALNVTRMKVSFYQIEKELSGNKEVMQFEATQFIIGGFHLPIDREGGKEKGDSETGNNGKSIDIRKTIPDRHNQ